MGLGEAGGQVRREKCEARFSMSYHGHGSGFPSYAVYFIIYFRGLNEEISHSTGDWVRNDGSPM